MHYIYIIFSKQKNTYYIGETHQLQERLQKHNTHSYNNSFSKIASDWEYALTYECKNKDHATYLEKFIKRMKSKKFTQKVIENPQTLTDILSKRI